MTLTYTSFALVIGSIPFFFIPSLSHGSSIAPESLNCAKKSPLTDASRQSIPAATGLKFLQTRIEKDRRVTHSAAARQARFETSPEEAKRNPSLPSHEKPPKATLGAASPQWTDLLMPATRDDGR